MVQYLGEKQWVPFCPAVQDMRQSHRNFLTIESGRQVFFDAVLVEEMEAQLLAQPARLQLLNRH